MLLAEALVLRADTTRRIGELDLRVRRNARSQEGEVPAEDPTGLLALYDGAATELQGLIARINRTNNATAFGPATLAAIPGGAALPPAPTLTDALAARDALRIRVDGYRGFAVATTVDTQRYSRSEIRIVSNLSVEAIQRQADRLSAAYRALDTAIQAANWATELVE